LAATVGATVVGGAAAAAGAGYSIAAGQDAKKQQARALQQQEQAQAQQLAQAQAAQRRSEMAMNAANRKQPDVAGIMERAGQQAGGGPSATMLTGPGGVDPTQLSLGRSTLLGG
jgi:transcription initiation factor TFIID subunit TAF12